jgi:hypothetical protein
MALILLGGLTAALALFLWVRVETPAPAEAGPAARTQAPRSGEIPRIDLGRLSAPRAEMPAGRRDVFGYGAAAPIPPKGGGPAPTRVVDATPMPVETVPTPPPVPPLSVKFIGAVEDKKGMKVAVLMTDKKEILTGQAGEVVANRLKIVKIGLESVDVQDVGGGSIRRIPLRGN